jgi:hypothetical protein
MAVVATGNLTRRNHPLDIAQNSRHLFRMIKNAPQTRSYFWLFL